LEFTDHESIARQLRVLLMAPPIANCYSELNLPLQRYLQVNKQSKSSKPWFPGGNGIAPLMQAKTWLYHLATPNILPASVSVGIFRFTLYKLVCGN
jgi:hypothetical protein